MNDIDLDTIRIEPASGSPRRLFVLLHGVGSNATDLLPLGHLLHRSFPQSAVVIQNGAEPYAGGGLGRQWFSVQGVTEENRPARVARALPAVEALVRREQQRYGVPQADTVVAGFSQGAIMALELAVRHDGLAGRVVSFSGRFAALPAAAPLQTTIHFFHGDRDPVMPARHAREASARLQKLGGNSTIDIAQGAAHALSPDLAQRAIERLKAGPEARDAACAARAA